MTKCSWSGGKQRKVQSATSSTAVSILNGQESIGTLVNDGEKR